MRAKAAIAYPIALFGGLTIGETYVATLAARRPQTSRRTASLSPRSAATYLSTAQRLLQIGLLVLTAGASVLLLDLTLTRDDAWAAPATIAATVWLAGVCAALAAQRLVLAAPVPLEDDRRLVREFATASAMQLLHRFTWGLGGLLYCVGAAIMLGPAPDLGPMLAAYLPPAGVAAIVHGIRRTLNRPDPLWQFARVGGSPA